MSTKKLVLCSLMTALVCIFTIIIQIPIPGTNGYINIGDSMIFVSSILFGPIVGMIAGGVGSCLADIFTGYTHWAVYSLIIKGFEGFIVGFLIKDNYSVIKSTFATAFGSLVMVIGYFIAGAILYGGIAVAIPSILSNAIQGVSCMIISIPIAYTLYNNSHFKNLLK